MKTAKSSETSLLKQVCQPSNWGDNCSKFWNFDTTAET